MELWQALEPDPVTPEVARILPVRQPDLWVESRSTRLESCYAQKVCGDDQWHKSPAERR